MSMTFIGNPTKPKKTAPSVKASASVTASKPVTGKGKLVPALQAAAKKVTKKSKGGATPVTKPKNPKPATATATPYVPASLSVGVSGQTQINALKAQLDQQKALRKYQEEASRRDLQTNLGIIDRSALEAYKGISDDYAGRGMLRSGGYAKTDDQAYTAVVEEKNKLNTAMEDLQRTNEYQNLIDQEGVNANVAAIKQAAAQAQMSNYLDAIANAQNTFGAQPTAKKPKAAAGTSGTAKKKKKKAGTTALAKTVKTLSPAQKKAMF